MNFQNPEGVILACRQNELRGRRDQAAISLPPGKPN
jgi:hypothetical protein